MKEKRIKERKEGKQERIKYCHIDTFMKSQEIMMRSARFITGPTTTGSVNTVIRRRCRLHMCSSPRFSSALPQARSSLDDIDYNDNDNVNGGTVDYRVGSPSRGSPIYVAATRQHVGKTAVALAMVSGLKKRFAKVGFIKPVGEESYRLRDVTEDGDGEIEVLCDKDAAVVKQHFNLDHLNYRHMSPVTIPPGYTRDYIDGRIPSRIQRELVENAYRSVSRTSDIVLCEGTGHCAVGSVVGASNAMVASWLGAKIILVANGGVGNTFDELELNRFVCDNHNLEIAGVIVNKVVPDKYEQTRYYISKLLRRNWGIPLLGCIPDRPFLGCPAMSDLERLLDGSAMVSGRAHSLRHYRVNDLELVATSLQVFLKNIRKKRPRTLYLCHASRNDILLGFLMETQRMKNNESGLVVCGADEHPLSSQVLDIMRGMDDESAHTAPPVLLCPQGPHEVTEMIHSYTPKLNAIDGSRVDAAVNHYEPYIDFDMILHRAGYADRTTTNTATTAMVAGQPL